MGRNSDINSHPALVFDSSRQIKKAWWHDNLNTHKRDNMTQTTKIKTATKIRDLMTGMTVLYKGDLLTVGRNDVKYDSFTSYSFRGDAASKTITRVIFRVPTIKGFRHEG